VAPLVPFAADWVRVAPARCKCGTREQTWRARFRRRGRQKPRAAGRPRRAPHESLRSAATHGRALGVARNLLE
jgi:hypothetical protein